LSEQGIRNVSYKNGDDLPRRTNSPSVTGA